MIAAKSLSSEDTLNSAALGEARLQQFAQRSKVRITRLQGVSVLVQRMMSMGLAPQKEVEILRKSGVSVVLRIGQTRLALRLSHDLIIFAVPQ